MSKFIVLAALLCLIRADEVFKTLSKDPYAAVKGLGSIHGGSKRLMQSDT
jgi:hypothetical protein